jgi:hypothetical protein
MRVLSASELLVWTLKAKFENGSPVVILRKLSVRGWRYSAQNEKRDVFGTKRLIGIW